MNTATNPVPQEKPYTYAHTANKAVRATAVQVLGDINSILFKSGCPEWFKVAVDAGAITESLSGQITLTLPKHGNVIDFMPQEGEWLVKTNITSDTNGFDVLTDATFKQLYKRKLTVGDWIFSLGGYHGTALIEQVTKIGYGHGTDPLVIHTNKRLDSSPLRTMWRFATTEEVQAQAHADSIAYKKFWGVESQPNQCDDRVPPHDLKKAVGYVGIPLIRSHMKKEDQQHYDRLPEQLTVYRGCMNGGDGLSWTLNKKVAVQFVRRKEGSFSGLMHFRLMVSTQDFNLKERLHNAEPKPVNLCTGTVHKSNCLVFFGRNEQEVFSPFVAVSSVELCL